MMEDTKGEVEGGEKSRCDNDAVCTCIKFLKNK